MNTKLLLAAALTALAITGPLGAAQKKPSRAITAALADPTRPAADTARDAARKPAEILAFAGIKPGQKVADFIMGGGYFTRLLARTVGPKGKVYAYQPAEFIAFQARYGEDLKTVSAAYPNITPVSDSLRTFKFAEPLDAIVTVQNYHDMHLAIAPAETASLTNARLFAALKPGGTLLVIDHSGLAGAALVDTADKLHRIDPAAARAEIEAAGFRFDGETAILRNASDARTASVFDPAMRGKTDQFVYRFRKPK